MAVRIRMKVMGSKKRPFYRIVAADSRSPRDGRFIEVLGYYNPMTDPPELKFDEDKVYKWLDNGAKPTPNTEQVLKMAGLLERWRLLRSGVKIHELDAAIEARREKQPKAVEKDEKKLSKKKAAAEAAAETKPAESPDAEKTGENAETGKAAEETPREGEPAPDAAPEKKNEDKAE